jgi:hypothetical protein
VVRAAGNTDTGDACVVAVFAHAPGATSGSLCTGTVTGAHTVLTAAHCVSAVSERGVDVPRRRDLRALHAASERGPVFAPRRPVHVAALEADVNDLNRSRSAAVIEASRIALYSLRRRRLRTAGTIRITTCSA